MGCTVLYVDRYYSSINVAVELQKMGLYVTGTLMHNRIPSQFTIKKNSAAYKKLSRGDFNTHTFQYKDDNDERHIIGITCWKDRQMVYTLTTDCDTSKSDTCVRRSKEGLVTIERPHVVHQYNEHMGGVDLADMRRLHVQTNIIGLHRWWLRMFFYLLDVGTCNAMVLYSLAKEERDINLATYKKALVRHFVGDAICPTVPHCKEDRHLLVRISENDDVRSRCTYCSMMDGVKRRTRYRCSKCKIPLCSVGTGKSGRDCFSIAHETPGVLSMLLQRHEFQIRQTAHKYRV